ncbi:MAG: putative transcriptional regulator, TetR family protein [Acidobacteria bacterium]|jgi:AcrR family transcriptional regulator|nr:putative transcriptional regulator, TetR family protein [Acidobacteriota bacterium]
MAAEVKRRQYDSARRRQAAERRRDAIVDTARRLFLRDGFARTTIATIAGDAGVSEETVYKTFGSKTALVRTIRDRALAGAGPVHAERRSDRMQAGAHDARTIIRGWGVLTVEVAPRVAPILLLVRDAAASDPELATLRDEMDAARRTRMTRNARTLFKAGHLRRGITLAAAADVLWTYSSPELYELLVIRRGWAIARYGRFVADAMIAALLPSSPLAGL